MCAIQEAKTLSVIVEIILGDKSTPYNSFISVLISLVLIPHLYKPIIFYQIHYNQFNIFYCYRVKFRLLILSISLTQHHKTTSYILFRIAIAIVIFFLSTIFIKFFIVLAPHSASNSWCIASLNKCCSNLFLHITSSSVLHFLIYAW